MAKFYGKIGFAISTETAPDVWTYNITERNYSGDLLKNTSRWSAQPTDANSDFTISNTISILSDPFAVQNFRHMKYVEFMGTKWNITVAEVQRPRIILTVGGVYNG